MSQVVVYSSDYCPYCMRAKALLEKKGIAFDEIKVDGCDDLFALERAGKLDALLHV